MISMWNPCWLINGYRTTDLEAACATPYIGIVRGLWDGDCLTEHGCPLARPLGMPSGRIAHASLGEKHGYISILWTKENINLIYSHLIKSLCDRGKLNVILGKHFQIFVYQMILQFKQNKIMPKKCELKTLPRHFCTLIKVTVQTSFVQCQWS